MVEPLPLQGEPLPQGQGAPPEEVGLVALGQALRTLLRFHQLSGIDRYPASAVLRPPASTRRPTSPPLPSAERRPPASAARTDQPPAVAPTRPEARPTPPSPTLTWQEVQQHIQSCRLCPLAEDRQGQIPGRGSTTAPLLVVGDYARQPKEFAPDCLFGQEEDRMLANMMLAIGCQPETVYVTNVLKCCPRPEAVPVEECLARCQMHLKAEMALVRPRVILAMGEMAMAALLGSGDSVVHRRGRFHPYRPDGPTGPAIPVMVTFHPRYLLSNPDFKKAAWQDLQMLQRQLRNA